MKRCPLCDRRWEIEKLFCPMDGHKLKDLVSVVNPDNEKGRTAPELELQFELLSEQISHQQALEDSLKQEDCQPSLAKIAEEAMESLKQHDQKELREQLQLYDLFNLHCRTVQYFADKLSAESDNFTCNVTHRDEYAQRLMIFTFAFGYRQYRRSFPLTVGYYREPRREVSISIDLYEIGPDKDSRHFRTERVGGRVERTLSGFNYTLSPPSGTEGVMLLKWLDQSFKNIFKVAYEA